MSRVACGCGEPAVTVLIIGRVRGRNGARTSRSSRIPLCARHEAAHVAQARRRAAAIAAAWQRENDRLVAARRAYRAALARPLLTFTVVS